MGAFGLRIRTESPMIRLKFVPVLITQLKLIGVPVAASTRVMVDPAGKPVATKAPKLVQMSWALVQVAW